MMSKSFGFTIKVIQKSIHESIEFNFDEISEFRILNGEISTEFKNLSREFSQVLMAFNSIKLLGIKCSCIVFEKIKVVAIFSMF